MIKYYCDVCNGEITRNYITHPLSAKIARKGKTVQVEVTASMNGATNAGELCKNCLIQVVAEGEESLFSQILNSEPYEGVRKT